LRGAVILNSQFSILNSEVMPILGQKRIFTSNESLPTTDPQTIWVVESGLLVLHSITVEQQQPSGNRSFLFNIGAGEALFGTALEPTEHPDRCRAISAIAIESTQVLEITLADLMAALQERDLEAIAWLDGWLNHIGAWWSKQPPIATAPSNTVVAQGDRFLSLVKEQCLVPLRPSPSQPDAARTVAWASINQGEANWQGLEDLRLGSSAPPLPLVVGTWLQAIDPLEIHTTPTLELATFDRLPASLEIFHAYFWYCSNILEQQQLAAEFRRFQERQQINRQTLESSMDDLAGVLAPESAEALPMGDALLVAAGAVGKAMGIKIQPIPASEAGDRLADPVETIARASQCRTRRVKLEGEWWKAEHEALLGYDKDDRPLAILPEAGNRYLLFDPESMTKTRVDRAAIADLQAHAYVFYRPLPLRVANALEIFRFGIKGYERDAIFVFVLGLLVSLLGMVTPQATAILVNDAIPDSNRTLLAQLGLALFAAAFGQAAFQVAQQIVTLRIESAADASLQPSVWDRVLKLSPAFFREYSSGDLVNRILAIGQIRSHLSGSTQRTLLSGVFALLNLGLMFVYSVKLALVGIGIVVLVAIVTVISSRIAVAQQRVQEQIDGEIDALTVELIEGVAKLRVAVAEERAFAAWARKYSHRSKLHARSKHVDDSLTVFNEAIPTISSILMFWFAILFLQMAALERVPGGLSAGSFLAFNAAFAVFLNGATEISNTLSNVLEVIPLWERAKPLLQSPMEADPSKADPGRLTGRITLDRVMFRYREDGPLTLNDVSISAEPGEFIAIVGPSGSGKSTVFRLLLGFENPLSGTVTYDGQDLAGLDVQAVRRQLGVVLQNVRISSAPIFDTIAAGALITLDEAWEAARMAGLDEDIKAMPMGMHTVVSEGGTNLSGGQRQRLLIARALVLKPKILLMDEATSALDNQTQTIVTESLDRLNATRIVIAHRLSTIRNADRIYVVEAGVVVQSGTYDELVNQPGQFARLVARQLD
jgi:NHLM bacteriocin system ABC transporter ATP-binding protein